MSNDNVVSADTEVKIITLVLNSCPHLCVVSLSETILPWFFYFVQLQSDSAHPLCVSLQGSVCDVDSPAAYLPGVPGWVPPPTEQLWPPSLYDLLLQSNKLSDLENIHVTFGDAFKQVLTLQLTFLFELYSVFVEVTLVTTCKSTESPDTQHAAASLHCWHMTSWDLLSYSRQISHVRFMNTHILLLSLCTWT